MPQEPSSALPDEKKTRTQLLQELAELRTRLSAAEKPTDQRDAGTDRHPRAEEALRESGISLRQSNQLLESVIESTPDLIAVQDTQHRYITFNQAYRQAFRQVFGSDLQIGSSMVEALAHLAEEQRKAIALWARALRGETVHFASEFGDPERERRVFEMRFGPIRDAEGQIIGAVEIASDITERKRAEEALRESEERYRAVFQNSQDAIIVTDPTGTGSILSVNPAAAQMFGYSEAEMLGLTREDLLETGEPGFGQVMEERSRAGAVRAVLTYKRKDGTRFFGELASGVFRDGGRQYAVAVIRDISERRQTEERLAHQALLLSRVHDVIMAHDERLRITYWNKTAEEVFGWTEQEVLGKDSYVLLQTKIPGSTREEGVRQLKETGHWEGEVDYRHKAGHYLTVHVSSAVVKGEDGQFKGLVTSMRDLSERKKTEEALRESEQDLNRAQAVSHTGSWRLDLGSKRLVWSEETYRIFGIPPVTPMNHERFIASVHPEDREFVLKESAAARKGAPYDIVHRILVGEEVRWVRQKAELEFDDSGALVGAFGTVQDITEHKQAEGQIESLSRFPAENPNPVLRVDRKGRLVYANPVSQPLLQHWGIEVGQSLPAPLGRLVRQALAHGVIKDIEVPFDSRDFLFSVAPVAEREYANLYGRDITKRKRAEVALQSLNQTLEQQVAERTAVAEQRAHQLQALALQLTETEEQVRRRIADLLHDDLQQLLSASRFQLSVLRPILHTNETATFILQQVDQLLDQSIQKSRHLSHELSPAILYHSGLAAAVEWLARWMEEHHGLEVQVDAKGKKRLENESLRAFLFRAVQELLLNVAKHAGCSSVQVTIKTVDEQVEVTVSDGGRGFDPQCLTRPRQPSEGFGLLSLQERTHYLGGRLEIGSAPGKGSRIRLTVPLEGLKQPKWIEAFHPEHPVASPVKTVDPRVEKHARYRILLVDDHPMMRQGLASVLDSQPDIEVIGEASTGQEAIDLARSLKPDVVVMDVVMPEMDGIEATRIIKAELPQVRVIGLSMLSDEDVSEQLLKAGAEGFINKGKAAEELVEAIRQDKSEEEDLRRS